MATSTKKDVQIFLDALEVNPKIAQNTTHIIDVNLIAPKLGTAKKSASRTVELEDGISHPRTNTFTDTILFRDTVEPTFGIEISLSEAVTNAIMQSMVRTGAGQLIKLLSGFITGASDGFVDALDIPLSSLSKAVQKDPGTKELAFGVIDVTTLQKQEILEIPLYASHSITKSQKRPAGHGNSTSVPKIVVKKGECIGKCKLRVEA